MEAINTPKLKSVKGKHIKPKEIDSAYVSMYPNSNFQLSGGFISHRQLKEGDEVGFYMEDGKIFISINPKDGTTKFKLTRQTKNSFVLQFKSVLLRRFLIRELELMEHLTVKMYVNDLEQFYSGSEFIQLFVHKSYTTVR